MNLEEQVAAVPFWWHSINLGGVVTPGWKSPQTHADEWRSFALPDLDGKTVLDVGAWDGFYSFECEKRGATVTALDRWEWPLELLDHRFRGTERYDPFPARSGFDTAHRIIGSKVKPLVGDFMDVELEQFDVVLFLGVLYHLRHPLAALEKLTQVTKELAVIETEAIGWDETRAICEFHEGDELGGDMSNWWVPNAAAVVGMCRAAGFASAEVVSPARTRPHYRLVVHARH